jgi:membrane associated rhomboid family serine protease
MNRRSSFSIPGYSHNAVLQLIVACGAGFVLYHMTRVSLIVFSPGSIDSQFKAAWAENIVNPAVALQNIESFKQHPWTILTYGWIHRGFMEWLSSMIWLYCFGNVVQNLVGYKQVIPTFIYGQILGGIFYVLTWFIPGLTTASFPVLTSNAGVMALAASTVTLAPKYRFYLGENFSIPLLVVVGIYIALNGLVHASHLPLLMLCVGGLTAGYLTMTLLKRGFQPGAWMYNISGALSGSMTPNEFKPRSKRRQQVIQLTRKQHEKEVTQRRVDEILEKIHQRGYASLTEEEREMLMKASKEAQD